MTRIVGVCLAALVVMGCFGDPGYSVAVKNESDVRLIVRGERYAGSGVPVQWVLPPRSGGWLLQTLGLPSEAPPMNYEILDDACHVLGVRHVEFAEAPEPGYSAFIIVVGPDMTLGLAKKTTADPTVAGELESTLECPGT